MSTDQGNYTESIETGEQRTEDSSGDGEGLVE